MHVSVKKDRAVLYNTLNHQLLEYRCGSPAYPLIKRLDADSNLYVIRLKEMDIQGETGAFIHKVREGFFGDVMDTRLSDKKPFQWKPILNLQPTLDSLTIGDEKSKSLSQDDIPDYLNILTLFLNSTCGQNCTICPDAYKQFSCCTKTVPGGFAASNRHEKRGKDCRLTIGDIDLMLRQSVNSNLHKINVTGGNIFDYPELREVAGYLNRFNMIKVYHLHILNIVDQPDFFKLTGSPGNQFALLVHFPVDSKTFGEKLDILEKYPLSRPPQFQFIVQSDRDVEQAESLVSRLGNADFRLLPYYNGENFDFFRDNIFTDRDSILAPRPGMNDILVRTALNTRDFKKMTVFSDKTIYANPNHPKIGKLGQNHMMDIVYTELHKGKSWTRVRKNVIPCKSCAFHSLCPPISNYEYALGQYNLCTIR